MDSRHKLSQALCNSAFRKYNGRISEGKIETGIRNQHIESTICSNRCTVVIAVHAQIIVLEQATSDDL